MTRLSEKRGIPGWIVESVPYLIFTLPVVLTCRLPFFWDTLQLASRHAHFFYESRFGTIFLPNDMDSGHIPVFGFYLALMWNLFGKTLVVSHLSMLPFVLGAVYFTRKLTGRLFPGRWSIPVTCFLLADATMLTQFTLVSPDVWIICFFSMALFGLRGNRPVLLAIAATGLTLTSMRGMMMVFAVFLAQMIFVIFFKKRSPEEKKLKIWQKYILGSVLVYLPAALIAATYFGLHYLRTGWIGYHAGMPWAVHFQRVGMVGFFRNLLILAWRLADQGRIFIWLTGILLLIRLFRQKLHLDEMGKWLMIFTLAVLVTLSYSALTYRNLSGHRYLIPVFYLVALTVIYLIFHFVRSKKRVIVCMGLLAAGLLSGNAWVYPDRVAKGWDALLAYLPYQQLRHEMIETIKRDKIDFRDVGTVFPNNIPMEYIDLNGDMRSFGSVDENMDQFRYVFYSNVFNDFSDAELTKLQSGWKVVRTLRKGLVKVILYENPGKVLPSE